MPRRTASLATVAFLAACQPPAPALPAGPIPAAIQTDVSFIGSERQEGRAVGSAGSERVCDVHHAVVQTAIIARRVSRTMCPRGTTVIVHFDAEEVGLYGSEAFTNTDVPSVALFTDFHSDYHRTTDVVSKLDVRGIERIVEIAESLVRFEADRR